jgi:hypothetical protein
MRAVRCGEQALQQQHPEQGLVPGPPDSPPGGAPPPAQPPTVLPATQPPTPESSDVGAPPLLPPTRAQQPRSPSPTLLARQHSAHYTPQLDVHGRPALWPAPQLLEPELPSLQLGQWAWPPRAPLPPPPPLPPHPAIPPGGATDYFQPLHGHSPRARPQDMEVSHPPQPNAPLPPAPYPPVAPAAGWHSRVWQPLAPADPAAAPAASLQSMDEAEPEPGMEDTSLNAAAAAAASAPPQLPPRAASALPAPQGRRRRPRRRSQSRPPPQQPTARAHSAPPPGAHEPADTATAGGARTISMDARQGLGGHHDAGEYHPAEGAPDINAAMALMWPTPARTHAQLPRHTHRPAQAAAAQPQQHGVAPPRAAAQAAAAAAVARARAQAPEQQRRQERGGGAAQRAPGDALPRPPGAPDGWRNSLAPRVAVPDLVTLLGGESTQPPYGMALLPTPPAPRVLNLPPGVRPLYCGHVACAPALPPHFGAAYIGTNIRYRTQRDGWHTYHLLTFRPNARAGVGTYTFETRRTLTGEDSRLRLRGAQYFQPRSMAESDSAEAGSWYLLSLPLADPPPPPPAGTQALVPSQAVAAAFAPLPEWDAAQPDLRRGAHGHNTTPQQRSDGCWTLRQAMVVVKAAGDGNCFRNAAAHALGLLAISHTTPSRAVERNVSSLITDELVAIITAGTLLSLAALQAAVTQRCTLTQEQYQSYSIAAVQLGYEVLVETPFHPLWLAQLLYAVEVDMARGVHQHTLRLAALARVAQCSVTLWERRPRTGAHIDHFVTHLIGDRPVAFTPVTSTPAGHLDILWCVCGHESYAADAPQAEPNHFELMLLPAEAAEARAVGGLVYRARTPPPPFVPPGMGAPSAGTQRAPEPTPLTPPTPPTSPEPSESSDDTAPWVLAQPRHGKRRKHAPPSAAATPGRWCPAAPRTHAALRAGAPRAGATTGGRGTAKPRAQWRVTPDTSGRAPAGGVRHGATWRTRAAARTGHAHATGWGSSARAALRANARRRAGDPRPHHARHDVSTGGGITATRGHTGRRTSRTTATLPRPSNTATPRQTVS